MRKFTNLLALSLLAAVAAAQSPAVPATPQTARQALIDMFFGKAPGTLVKHLPAVTLSALDKSGAMATLQQYSLLAGQLQTKGKSFETFDSGPVLLAATDRQSGEKSEITVENDSLRGEEDKIEVSFRSYKNNQPERSAAAFLPRITFGMKMESGVWKLNEILVTLRLPLADPDFLKGVVESMKARNAATATLAPHGQLSPATFGGDAAAQSATIQPATIQGSPAQSAPAQSAPFQSASAQAASVQSAMRTINTAEVIYSSTYPATGFTCTLSDLDGFGGGQPNEHQAMLIPSGLASGKKPGYTLSLSGCSGNPVTSFHLVAVPAGGGSGRPAFCSDQSAVIRSSADGSAATCLASGTPVQ